MTEPRKCDFIVEIVPEAWRRARVMRLQRGVRHFQDAKTRCYEAQIGFAAKLAMRGQPLLSGPVSAVMTFSMPIPASWSHRKAQDARLGLTLPSVAPDLDNLAKAILDGCNGVVFEDDKQVVRLDLTKRYADRPGVAVSRSEEHTSELQSHHDLVCRLLL